ncbi:long-chain base (LCB) kinase 1 [Striga asiatica]|uniref:Long-chain base (LCB) kinase 1 n=1 Tax=Striga asiatica TaxID=4170 RepID=A0A5A7RB54_STRAF|nr:long-chain base (LCB) kinase 1 [Striga asiatica]
MKHPFLHKPKKKTNSSTAMTNLRPNKIISSAGNFSFPVQTRSAKTRRKIQEDDDEFEFRCLPSPGSPADHLFFNGRLLPHVFPVGPRHASFSRSASRASRDSLTSSRSNSTNSSCSSARTSTSESSSKRGISSNRLRAGRRMGPVYDGGSGRWRLIAAAPAAAALGRGGGSRRPLRPAAEAPAGGGKGSWFGGKVLKSFVSACKECHAIKTNSLHLKELGQSFGRSWR